MDPPPLKNPGSAPASTPTNRKPRGLNGPAPLCTKSLRYVLSADWTSVPSNAYIIVYTCLQAFPKGVTWIMASGKFGPLDSSKERSQWRFNYPAAKGMSRVGCLPSGDNGPRTYTLLSNDVPLMWRHTSQGCFMDVIMGDLQPSIN